MKLTDNQKIWLEHLANDCARSNLLIEKLAALQLEVRCAISEFNMGFKPEFIEERLKKALKESHYD